jgi:hypothetical protein
MTMRTRFKLTCACGHEGEILLKENDQPYSKSWERYSLEGYSGGSFSSEGGVHEWEEIFVSLKPKCPKCSSILTPEQIS